MDLTDEQKQTVSNWVAEGAGLAELQKRLRDELGVSATYMDVRFLVIDLGLELKEEERTEPAPPSSLDAPESTPASGQAAPAGGGLAGADGQPIGGGVSVELDRVTKAGSVVSGSVTFSDGVTATWSIDNFGRLALAPSTSTAV